MEETDVGPPSVEMGESEPVEPMEAEDSKKEEPAGETSGASARNNSALLQESQEQGPPGLISGGEQDGASEGKSSPPTLPELVPMLLDVTQQLTPEMALQISSSVLSAPSVEAAQPHGHMDQELPSVDASLSENRDVPVRKTSTPARKQQEPLGMFCI